MYYRLNDEAWVRELAQFVAALPAAPFASDQRNFKARVGLRVAGRCRVGIQQAHLSEVAVPDASASLRAVA